MKEWTQAEEAENLRRLFAGMKGKGEFAKRHEIPGGASMLSQHQSGHRPISLEAGIAYAKAFGVPLSKISPRLANMVCDVVRLKDGDVHVETRPPLAVALEIVAEALAAVGPEKRQSLLSVLDAYSADPEAKIYALQYLQSALSKPDKAQVLEKVLAPKMTIESAQIYKKEGCAV